MDKFCTSTSASASDSTPIGRSTTTKSTDRPTDSVFEMELDDEVRPLYAALSAIEKKAFRIAHEHLGSSFDYMKCKH